MLSKEAILSANDKDVKPFPVKEWGGDVGLGKLSFSEVMELKDLKNIDGTDDETRILKFLAKTFCDENGKRLFTDEEFEKLLDRNYEVILRITKEAYAHNGLTETSREDTEKNSESGETGDSTSTSPAN